MRFWGEIAAFCFFWTSLQEQSVRGKEKILEIFFLVNLMVNDIQSIKW